MDDVFRLIQQTETEIMNNEYRKRKEKDIIIKEFHAVPEQRQMDDLRTPEQEEEDQTLDPILIASNDSHQGRVSQTHL